MDALNKIKSSPEYGDDRLLFIKDYQYSLGVADLVPFGAYQYDYLLYVLVKSVLTTTTDRQSLGRSHTNDTGSWYPEETYHL